MQPAVFLDRDNTLIQNDGDLGEPDQVRLADGVAAGLRMLREAGFHLVVVTNQAGVARGRFTEDDVDAVHQRIASMVDAQAQRVGIIDRFYYCPYHPEGTVAEYCRDHIWRKPHPGMLLQAARDMSLDLASSWMVGDQVRDIEAGRNAGCRTVLVSQNPEVIQRANATMNARTFLEAVQLILAHSDRVPGTGLPGSFNGQPGAATAAATPPATAAAGPAVSNATAREPNQDLASLRRVVTELVEEIRSDRLRRADFTLIRMVAGACQLLALALAALGFLQMAQTDVFIKWMIGAAMVQLITITILLVDLKG